MASRTRLRALLGGVLLFVALAARPTPAHAAPSAAEREAARRFMDEGMARLKANDPVHALENFQKAHELMHVPTTGLAVARAHLAAGHLIEARDAAVEVARTSKEPGEPPVFEKARKHAREIESQVKNRIPTLKIHVRGGTPSFVAVDGNEIPISLLAEAVPVNPGKRVVSAKGDGGSEGKTEVDVRESEKSDVDVTLAPKGSDAKAASTATNTDKPADKTPTEKPKIVGFGNDDGVTIGKQRSSFAQGLIIGGFATGAAGLGFGGVTGFMTLGKASSVKSQCANNICAPEAKDDLSSAKTLSTLSTVGFIVGIAGVSVGILGLVMPEGQVPMNKKVGRVTLFPAGNGLGGTF